MISGASTWLMYRCAFTLFPRPGPIFWKMTGPRRRLRPIAPQFMTLGPPHVLCPKTLLAAYLWLRRLHTLICPSAWLVQYRLSSVKRTFCHCRQFQFMRCCARCCRCRAVSIGRLAGRRQHRSRSDSRRRMVWPLKQVRCGCRWCFGPFRQQGVRVHVGAGGRCADLVVQWSPEICCVSLDPGCCR